MAASRSPDGKPMKFVRTLSEMEMEDHEAARIIHDEREALQKLKEAQRVARIRQKTCAV